MYILNTSFISFRRRNDVVSGWSEAATQSFSFNLFPSHTRWIINTLSRPVHMSYIHAGIDRHNCTHMRSSAFSSIRSHSKVKDFLENSDKGNVFIRRHENKSWKLRELKAKETPRTSGEFFIAGETSPPSSTRHEKISWRDEFVSVQLRKIRYHVLVSVWCQPLGLVPECLVPLRWQWGGGGSPRVQAHSH